MTRAGNATIIAIAFILIALPPSDPMRDPSDLIQRSLVMSKRPVIHDTVIEQTEFDPKPEKEI
jgi:hypothetical protein